MRHALREADVVAGVGDKRVVPVADRELPGEQVEAVVDVVMNMQRGGRAWSGVVLDDDRERPVG
jgi:hypothetical protein